MSLSIVQVRQAVEQLRLSDKDVTAPNIKEVLGATYSELVSMFRINGLKVELGIVSAFDALRARYKAAADRLSKQSVPVTVGTLAGEMKLKRSAVSMWIARNKGSKSELGLVSGYNARRLKRADAYKTAADQLRMQNQPVNKSVIARLTNYNRTLVSHDFERDHVLAQLLMSTTKQTESA